MADGGNLITSASLQFAHLAKSGENIITTKTFTVNISHDTQKDTYKGTYQDQWLAWKQGVARSKHMKGHVTCKDTHKDTYKGTY